MCKYPNLVSKSYSATSATTIICVRIVALANVWLSNVYIFKKTQLFSLSRAALYMFYIYVCIYSIDIIYTYTCSVCACILNVYNHENICVHVYLINTLKTLLSNFQHHFLQQKKMFPSARFKKKLCPTIPISLPHDPTAISQYALCFPPTSSTPLKQKQIRKHIITYSTN